MIYLYNCSLLVLFYVLSSSSLVSKSFGRNIPAEAFYELNTRSRHVLWKVNHINSFQNDIVGFHWIVSSKWRPEEILQNYHYIF